MKNKTVFVLCALMLTGFLFAAGLSGQSLEDLIGSEQAAALIAGERPVAAQFDNPQPRLAPRHDVLRRHIETVRLNLDPGVMVETISLYRKPPIAETNAWSAAEEAALYNEALALSTLAGLQYFSASRGVMRTFYETSHIVDGPSTKRALPDPVYPRPPAELSVFSRQKDTTFGDNIYQYDYYTAPGALIFVQQNLTSLSAGIIPAIGRNNLRSAVGVLDAGDYVLVYVVSMAKVRALPGMRERIGNSFSNRAEAILNWFSAQADEAFRKAHLN